MPRIRVDPGYGKGLKRLPRDIVRRATQALARFMEDPSRPGLRFEKLQGWDDLYSIRINRSYRILLRQETDKDGEVFAAVDVGTHRLYRR
jgi:plasmid maintenance system killer protein